MPQESKSQIPLSALLGLIAIIAIVMSIGRFVEWNRIDSAAIIPSMIIVGILGAGIATYLVSAKMIFLGFVIGSAIGALSVLASAVSLAGTASILRSSYIAGFIIILAVFHLVRERDTYQL
jgi:hypothetical protein